MKKLIHLHIPKSAGSTFNKCLKYYFDDDISFVKGHFNYSYHIPEEVTKSKVIIGHVDMKGVSDRFDPSEISIVSFLRNPFDRIISGYYNILRDKTNPVNKEVIKMNLLEYVSSGIIPDLDNGQVRRLSSLGCYENEHTHVTESHYQQALSNIDKYDMHFGISEYFNLSLLHITKNLQLGIPRYITVNRGKNRRSPKDMELHLKALTKIAELNQYDIRLVALIEKKLLDSLNITKNEEITFRILNRLYYFQHVPVLIKNKYFK